MSAIDQETGEIIEPETGILIANSFRHSIETAKISAAFVKFQGLVELPTKDSDNPFFHSKYADLASVIVAAKPALKEAKLAVIQTTNRIESFERGIGYICVTRIIHSSGEWYESEIPMPLPIDTKEGSQTYGQVKIDPQSYGSALSYARRYGMQAALCLSAEDDDGNKATTQKNEQKQKQITEKEKVKQLDAADATKTIAALKSEMACNAYYRKNKDAILASAHKEDILGLLREKRAEYKQEQKEEISEPTE